jgi:hypothetical protein
MKSDWIEDLRKYFFSHRQQNLDVNAAIDLKQKHIPKKLYKYRSVNEFAINNLVEDTIWCTNAADFNDPYDSSLCFDFSQDFMNQALTKSLASQTESSDESVFKIEDIDRVSKSDDPLKSLIDLAATHTNTPIEPNMADRLYEVLTQFNAHQIVEMNERFNTAIKQGYKICSFSERVNSMLMWSHYSDNHTGFVMEYNFPELGVSDVRSRCMWPVLYDDNLFDASAFFNEQREFGASNNLFGIISSIHKAKDWSYEHEWRLILPFSPSDPPLNYAVPKPKALYLGAKIPDEKRKILIDIALKKKLDVYMMKLSHNRFEMVPEKIDVEVESSHNNSIQPPANASAD